MTTERGASNRARLQIDKFLQLSKAVGPTK